MANISYEEMLFTAIKNGLTSVKSVYDIWLELGNTGTPQDFLNSLKGTSATVVNNVTVSSSSWLLNEGIYKATISNENITTSSVINVNFDNTSINSAIENGVLGYTNSIDGGFEIYSNFKPTSDLIINYAIINE